MWKEIAQIALGFVTIFVLFRLWFVVLGKLWDQIEKAFSRDFEDK